jgi:hypothetical protein
VGRIVEPTPADEGQLDSVLARMRAEAPPLTPEEERLLEPRLRERPGSSGPVLSTGFLVDEARVGEYTTIAILVVTDHSSTSMTFGSPLQALTQPSDFLSS